MSPLKPFSFGSRAVNGRAECPSCPSSIAGEANYYRHLKKCQFFLAEQNGKAAVSPASKPALQPLFPSPSLPQRVQSKPQSSAVPKPVPFPRLPVKLPPLLRMSGVQAGPISLKPTIIRDSPPKPFSQVGSRTQIERVRKLGGAVQRNVAEFCADPVNGLPQTLQIGPIPITVDNKSFEAHFSKDTPDPVEVCVDLIHPPSFF